MLEMKLRRREWVNGDGNQFKADAIGLPSSQYTQYRKTKAETSNPYHRHPSFFESILNWVLESLRYFGPP